MLGAATMSQRYLLTLVAVRTTGSQFFSLRVSYTCSASWTSSQYHVVYLDAPTQVQNVKALKRFGAESELSPRQRGGSLVLLTSQGVRSFVCRALVRMSDSD